MQRISDPQKSFRQAMAHLSAAVSVLTTNGPGGKCGVTASAVCSVTDSPPTLLVCLNRSSAMYEVFATNQVLCVNVLEGEHTELARHFSGVTGVPMSARFEWPIWDRGQHDLPVLRDALVSLQGQVVECKAVGSHSVMFIKLIDIKVREDAEALVYYGRQFHRVRCVREPAASTPAGPNS
ncbi:4-hydroxyphenylacetate 3-monooxygenase, reductase component [Burkholderia metallica]|uniref:4-hydroxyphenylacetate 3-monooxygenase, reductase component n=1 Tax=Burkholderia metallica TaxID=488729 RepID=UPI00157B442B|nr:4-hydroxyphenylacetate 3-monooxygenase, reductase component [Burkholderia metallica]NTZ82987.1 4-hydroxyphenylacetate 3-monooxygenase, reductase component [Burkholderia metallica]